MTMTNNYMKIGKVLGNFDFIKTQALMEDLNWTWAMPDTFEQEVPIVSAMVDMAHLLLIRAADGYGFCASGGFEATFKNGTFTLKFVTEEFSNEEVSGEDTFAFTPNLETVSEGI